MARVSDDVFFQSISELNARLRAKEFSAVELTRAFCDRMERMGPRYNALALTLRKRAIREAREVDGDIKWGRMRGPLQGIPYGAKDLLAVAGQVTTWGAKPYAAQVFDFDATVVTRLAKAGAVCIAKLAMVELAGGGGYRYASASLFGPGLNPWDRTRWSGGSSSGSGSAVAAGLAPFALGSETSGSILTPSALCGLTGLRPTYGLVSRHGAMPLSWTLDKIGPMCRSAEDCGLVLAVIAGKDDKDPGSAGKSFYFAPKYHRDIKTVRIGYHPADWEKPAWKEALDSLRSTGAQLQPVELKPDLAASAAVSTIIACEGASVFEELIESGRVDELADARQIAGLKAGFAVSARDYLRAQRIRRLVQSDFRRVLTDVDLIVAPVWYDVAPKVSEPLDRSAAPARAVGSGDASAPAPAAGLRVLTPAGNLAGLPALALPCGFSEGLPLGMQLVGRPFSENLLVAAGMAFQTETTFHRRRPDLT